MNNNHAPVKSPSDTLITYSADGRKSFDDLIQNFDGLIKSGWTRELVCKMDGADLIGNRISVPVYTYLSCSINALEHHQAFWILAGIHGEEPAGPNALAENSSLLLNLHEQKIPIVLMPLLNPLGYIRDDRYFDAHRDEKPGHSVTDSEHLLRDIKDPSRIRQPKPSNIYADKILTWIQRTINSYPPLIVIDHHEDELNRRNGQHIDSGFTYSYGYGQETRIAPACKLITDLLITNGFPIQKSGVTRFGEKINNGFVLNNSDGSVDEYLISQGASACFVIETTRDDEQPIALKHRIRIHKEIMGLYLKMWTLLR